MRYPFAQYTSGDDEAYLEAMSESPASQHSEPETHIPETDNLCISDAPWYRKPEAGEFDEVRDYVTVRDLHWPIGVKGSAWIFTIEAGKQFESSVPRWVPVWIFDRHDPCFLKAAVIHDSLLEAGYNVTFADSQWLDAAKSGHAPRYRLRMGYAGIRLYRFVCWVLRIKKDRPAYSGSDTT